MKEEGDVISIVAMVAEPATTAVVAGPIGHRLCPKVEGSLKPATEVDLEAESGPILT